MSTNKWMSKLTSDFGAIAESMPDPKDAVIPMPSPSLNWAIGNGGLVEGKAICFFGPESGGKSLLMQLTLIEIQKKDPNAICVLFDAEYSFNKAWFKKLGGDLERLYVRQTNDPVKIFDYISGEMLELVQDGCPIKAIAIDSVKSIKYPKDNKKVSTDQTMGGGGASYLGSALKHVTPVIRENNITCLLIQQVYEEMDQYKKMRNPYIVPDGRALKHFCDYMAQVDKLETKDGIVESGSNLHGGSAQIGHKVRVKFKKNRVSAPYRTAQFTLNYESGIVDQGNEVFELAKSLGIIYHPVNPETGKENNQMWTFAGMKPVRGEDNMRAHVLNDPRLVFEIIEACNSASEDATKARNEAVGADIKDIDLEVEL
jgi:recombination protein RecA